MENNTAVMEKAEKKKRKKNKDVAAATSMADQLSDVAPERRRLFRRACNSVALTVLLQLVILYTIASLITGAYMLFNGGMMDAALSGNTDSIMDATNNLLSDPKFMLWSIIASAVGAVCANLVSALVHCSTRGYKLFEGFKEGRLNFKLFIGGFLAVFAGMYAWNYLFTAAQLIFKFSDPVSQASNEQAMVLLSKDNLVGLIIYSAYVCVLAPITEEILFRGVLLKTLSKYNVGFAAFVSALFFGLVHGNLIQTPGAFLAGLALAYVAIRSGSLRGPILIHMMLNTYSTVSSYFAVNMDPESKEYALFSYGLLGLNAAIIIAAIVVLIACGKKMKWEAIDPSMNHILLPKVNTRVKFRFGHFITSIFVLITLYVLVELILVNSGFEPMTVKLITLIANSITAA